MITLFKPLLLLSLIISLSGGSSIFPMEERLANAYSKPFEKSNGFSGVYMATGLNASFINAYYYGHTFIINSPNYFLLTLACLDMPFSVVTDTVFLPTDLIFKPVKKEHKQVAPGNPSSPDS